MSKIIAENHVSKKFPFQQCFLTLGQNKTTHFLLSGLLPTYLIIALLWIPLKGWFQPIQLNKIFNGRVISYFNPNALGLTELIFSSSCSQYMYQHQQNSRLFKILTLKKKPHPIAQCWPSSPCRGHRPKRPVINTEPDLPDYIPTDIGDCLQIMSAIFGGVWTPPPPFVRDCQQLAYPPSHLCQRLSAYGRPTLPLCQ